MFVSGLIFVVSIPVIRAGTRLWPLVLGRAARIQRGTHGGRRAIVPGECLVRPIEQGTGIFNGC